MCVCCSCFAMATKLPVIINKSEAYNDEVLKCMKDTLKKKSGEIVCKYEPTKAYIRDHESYITDIDDTNKAWREKYNRRNRNLSKGFFADKSKAYQSVGKVYLESGDLIFSSLTSDFLESMVRAPRKIVNRWPKNGKPKKVVSPLKKPMASDGDADTHERAHLDAGYSALKKRLLEVKKMRKGVHATQGLYTYLTFKSLAEENIQKKDEFEMIAPQKNQWKIVRAVGKIMGACRTKDSVTPQSNKVLQSAFRKKGVLKKSKVLENDLEDMEDKEEALIRWRQQKKQQYLTQKLQCINTLLCAIFNMKYRHIKQNTPLSAKAVKDLFRQNVAMDQYNNPISSKIPQTHVSDDCGGTITEPTTPENVDQAKSPLSSTTRKRVSSVAISNYGRKGRLSQLVNKPKVNDPNTQKIETWEDLLSAGEKNKRSGLKSGSMARNGIKHGRRKDPTTPSVEMTAPWHTIANAEKNIEAKKKAALLGFVSKRTAEDVLQDIRDDFVKLQKQMEKDAESEMSKLKNDQYKTIHNKLKVITLGPIVSVALDKMRAEANILSQDRHDESMKPMKWFVDLREEIRLDTMLKDETINSILKLIARFQHEDSKTMPFAKEKLCLLVMSMPLHMLMQTSTLHAVAFVLTRILGSPMELMKLWLTCRKIPKTNINQPH